MLNDKGFRLACDKKSRAVSTLQDGKAAASRFRNLSQEDRTISGTFIQAFKQVFVSLTILGEEVLGLIPALNFI